MKTIAFIHTLDLGEQNKWLTQFNTLMPNEQLVLPNDLSDEQAKLIKIAIVANPEEHDLKRFPNLIWIHSLWAGVERIVNTLRLLNSNDNAPKLVRLIDPHLANTMAEAVLTWTLYLYRNLPEYMAQQRQQLWRPIPCPNINTVEVSILGTGELGMASMVTLVNQGFSVNSWSRGHKEIANVNHYSGPEGLTTLLKKTDILICLLPLTDKTRKLLNKSTLSLLPKGAKLINFSRGGVIDHSDLIEVLDIGQLSHAVLDVFEQEPLDQNSPFWQHPKLSILPHISATTNIETASKIVADNILNYRKDGSIPNSVDLLKGY